MRYGRRRDLKALAAVGVYLCGNPPGCSCTPDCGLPCWMRPGVAPEGDETCTRCGCAPAQP